MGILDKFIDSGRQQQEETREARARADTIHTSELDQWIDNQLAFIGKSARDYIRSKDEADLQEAMAGYEGLGALLESLGSRRIAE